MPDIVIVAGPNGAGKTSFANEFLPSAARPFAYVNADEIARGLAVEGGAALGGDIAAARLMLAQVDDLARRAIDFMFETTLANLTYATRIPRWRAAGFQVALIYLRLPSVEASIERVERRVAAGGHAIPEPVIRRRFDRSLEYLDRVYKPIVDEWSVWDSREGEFTLAQASEVE